MTKTLPKLRAARKVLVIDDDERFCVLLSRMLSDCGYKVIANNRTNSDNLFEMTEEDIIFVDMIMPGVNGLQVLDILSSYQIKSSVVLMSGAGDVLATGEALAKLKDIRFIGVLRKPFRLSDIYTVLKAS
jgi:DNA-binding NtrC family response regulator